MLPHRRRHRGRDPLGMHEVPAPRHHREPGDGAPDAVPLQHPRHGGRGGRDRVVRPQYLAELAQLLRPHHPTRRHRVHGFGGADLERLQVLLLPHLLRRQGAEQGAERHLRDRAEVAVRLDRRGEGRRNHPRHRAKMAVGDGDLGLRGRRPGRRQSVGPWAGAGAIRSAGDFAHLVARSSGRNQRGHDLCARDPARQALPLRRAHRRNADRAQERYRDRVQFPGQADHRGRSAAGLWRSCEVTREAPSQLHLSPGGRGRASEASEGEGVRTLQFFSNVRTPSPLPSPLWGEGVRRDTGDAEYEMMRFIVPLSDRAATDPDRVGPKAANLARLAHAGLPTPGGFCITADAYHRQIQHLELTDALREYPNADQPTQRRLAVEIRLKLYQSDLAPDLLADILTAWWNEPKPAAVRSSALIEDRADSNFAGQFESFLGVNDDTEFLTALRACWAALWTTNARRYMAQHDLDPADTAMAVLVQPLIAA